MAYDVGTAFLQIVPSFRDIEKNLSKGVRDIAKNVERSIADALPKGAAEGFQKMEDEAKKSNTRQSALSSANNRRIMDALRQDSADLEEHRRKLVSNSVQWEFRARAKAAADLEKKLDADTERLFALYDKRNAERVAAEAAQAKKIADTRRAIIENSIKQELARVIKEEQDLDTEYAAAVARQAKRREQEAKEATRREEAENKRRLDNRLALIQNTIAAELAAVAREEDELNRALAAATARQNARRAREADRAAAEAKRNAEKSVKDQEAAFAKTVEGRVRGSLTEALAAFPPIKIDADSSNAERKVAALQARMATLRDAQIGVDIDTRSALHEVAEIEEALKRLVRRENNLAIRANAFAALSEIRNASIGVDSLKREMGGLGNVSDIASSRLTLLINTALSLGPAIVPIAYSAAGAIGFLGTAAVSAAAGLGVFALGVSGIGDAVKALNTEQEDSGKIAKSLGRAQNAVTSANEGVQSSLRSLASTRRNADEAALAATERIADAESALQQTRKDSARSVTEATRAYADAQADLTRVEGEARDVRRDLNEAIREARRDIEQLGQSIAQNALDQREANTAILEEREKLDKILTNPRSTLIEKRNAQEAYDARVLQLKDLQIKAKDLADDQQRYNRDGVEASDKVIAVRKRIEAADQRVTDGQARVRDAGEKVTRAQEDGARRIGAAEQSVSRARRAAASQQRQSAEQILASQEAVAKAQRAQIQAVTSQAVAGGDAVLNVQDTMNRLSPAGQNFARFLFGLKDELQSLRGVAQKGLLPGLQTGIENLLPYFPELQKFVGKVADGLGDMFVQASKVLTSPSWRRFFGFIDDNAVPIMDLLFKAGANVATGLLDIVTALTPLNKPIGEGLVSMTETFAQWAAGLRRNKDFQEFLDYVREAGPDVLDFIKEFGELALRLIDAFKFWGDLVINGLTLFAETVNDIDPTVLTIIATAVGAMSTAFLLLAIAVKGVRGAREVTKTLREIRDTGFQKYAAGADIARGKTDNLNTAMGRMRAKAVDARTALLNLGKGTKTAAKDMGDAGRDVDRVSASLDGGKKGGLRGSIKRVGGVVGILAGIGAAVSAVAGDDRVYNMNALNKELEEFGRTGKLGSEAAKLLGKNLDNLTGADTTFYKDPGLELLLDDGFGNKAQKKLAQIGESLIGFTGIPDAIPHSVTNLQKTLDTIDSTLAGMVDNGNAEGAAAALARIKDNLPDSVSLDELNKGLPNYNTALGEMKDAASKAADVVPTVTDALDAQAQAANRAAAIESGAAARTGKATEESRKKIGDAYDANATKIQQLQDLYNAFNSSEATFGTKADAVRKYIEGQTGALINANEAAENYAASVDSFPDKLKTFSDVMASNAGALKNNKDKLDINTAAGRRNRDALQEVATNIREMFLQDIASGTPIEEATKRHDDRVRALKEEARRGGAVKKNVGEIIDQYGGVPEELKTDYNTGKTFDKVYEELVRLNFMQKLVADGITDPDQAALLWEQQKANNGNKFNYMYGGGGTFGRATGGPIYGPGTKTSDSVPIMASRGEFMQQASAVDYYGSDLMWALNMRKIPRDVLPRFAGGGEITRPHRIKQVKHIEQAKSIKQAPSTKAPITVNLIDVALPTTEEARRIAQQALDPFAGFSAGTPVGSLEVARIAESTARNLNATTKQMVALMEAGIVESGMQNLSYGDRDSLGFLQQRAGWGTAQQRMDVAYATAAFIRAAKRKDRKDFTAGQLAQAVQVSAYPDRYGKREADAYAILNRESPYVGGFNAQGTGGRGYKWQLAVLRAAFPDIAVYSTQRDGARTLSGNRSWHAVGRAVDVEPSRTIAEWIYRNYGPSTLELITPFREFNLLRGRPHRYSERIERQHGVGSAGNDHVHWAYDSGGWLPPGATKVINNTGRPEAVFTSEQFRDIRELARGRGGMNPSQVYNFEFANTTLTPDRLRSMQQRQDVVDRVNRSNY